MRFKLKFENRIQIKHLMKIQGRILSKTTLDISINGFPLLTVSSEVFRNFIYFVLRGKMYREKNSH